MFPVKDSQSGDIKYTTRSRAKVVDNRDPLNQGRIIVEHPQLGHTTWMPYLNAPGTFDVPKIGDIVMVEAEVGWYTHPLASGNLTRVDADNANIPSVFKRTVPTVRGMYSPGGHTIVLDDGVVSQIGPEPKDTNTTDLSRGIRITTSAGNEIQINEESSKRNILIRDINGNSIEVNYGTNEIRIFSTGKIKSEANESSEHESTADYKITSGAEFKAQAATVKIESSGAFNIQSGGVCNIIATGAVDLKSTGTTTVEGSNVILKSPSNVMNGGVITSNAINNDPITGIPLTPVGGVITS